jgi:hypothetical protein
VRSTLISKPQGHEELLRVGVHTQPQSPADHTDCYHPHTSNVSSHLHRVFPAYLRMVLIVTDPVTNATRIRIQPKPMAHLPDHLAINRTVSALELH